MNNEEVERVAEAIFDEHMMIRPTTVQWPELKPEHRTDWYRYAKAAILTLDLIRKTK